MESWLVYDDTTGMHWKWGAGKEKEKSKGNEKGLHYIERLDKNNHSQTVVAPDEYKSWDQIEEERRDRWNEEEDEEEEEDENEDEEYTKMQK